MSIRNEKYTELDMTSGISCLEDESYAEEMEKTVEPYLAARRVIGYAEVSPSVRLRYGFYAADEPHDTVVISHGFTETLEKYDETAYYFLQRGYSVFVPEHRGHGLSTRETEDYSLAHISRFDDYVEDFLAFIDGTVCPKCVGRLFLVGHSMGGAIGVLAMERRPELFYRAALLSPMFGVNLPAPRPMTLALCGLMCALGRDKAYVMGQKPFSGVEDFKNSATACRERYDYFFDKSLQSEYRQGCAASYSWARESIRGTDELMDEGELAKIKTPILVFSGTADEVVSLRAHRRFAERVESSRLVVVPKGKHELFTDTAQRTGALLLKMFGFFEEK